MQRGRLLFVSLRFPPHGGAGVQRTSRFVRYLPDFGWDPHVLTGPLADTRGLRDATMLDVVPRDVPVTRTGLIETRRIFRQLGRLRLAGITRAVTPSFPNMDAGWILHAYRAGRRLLHRHEFDAIYSSAYPMASHIVAYLLKRHSGLPWIADYRDEWSTREITRWPTRWHRRTGLALDAEIARAADRIVTTSPLHSANFARHFGGAGNGKVVTITNGYDDADFQGPAEEPPRAPPQRFVLTHVGSLFAWREPQRFFAIIDRLVSSGALPPARVAIPLVGRPSGLGSYLRLRELGIVRETGFVSHEEAVRWIRSSSALLLLNTERSNIPAKTFDYLASGRPILGILPEGPAADLVRRARAGQVVDPRDSDGIARAVLELFHRWEAGTLQPATDDAVVRQFTRRHLAGRLAALLDEMVAA